MDAGAIEARGGSGAGVGVRFLAAIVICVLSLRLFEAGGTETGWIRLLRVVENRFEWENEKRRFEIRDQVSRF